MILLIVTEESQSVTAFLGTVARKSAYNSCNDRNWLYYINLLVLHLCLCVGKGFALRLNWETCRCISSHNSHDCVTGGNPPNVIGAIEDKIRKGA